MIKMGVKQIIIEAFLETENPNVSAKSIGEMLTEYCRSNNIKIIELLVED